MAVVVAPPVHRLQGKGPAWRQEQQTLPEPLELEDEAPTRAVRMAYLVTLPRPVAAASADGHPLVAPGARTKAQIVASVLDAFARPEYAQAWHANGPIAVVRVGVWREFHKPGPNQEHDVHDHVAVLGAAQFRYLPVKRALLVRHGLASHWSGTHTGYWSCVRYCAVPSPKKPLQSLDHQPELWPAAGPHKHPPVFDCCYEPVTARALGAKRQKVVQEAASAGRAEPRVNDLDVWALVVRTGVRNDVDDQTAHLRLAAYAKNHCGEAMVSYLFRRRHKLHAMIDDIWQWEDIEQAVAVARRSRLEALAAAEGAACVCGGEWPAYATNCLMQNAIPIAELCHDVLGALTRGRSETTPAIMLAGLQGGEGKSFFLKPLHTIFDGSGFVFGTPERGNYPLLDLPAAKVALLDEFRWDDRLISWSALCLWLDGSPVPIGCPQNIPGASGNIMYKGRAPIFMTGKLSDLEWLQYHASIDPQTGRPYNTDASMILRRLKVYKFTQRVAPPPRAIAFCGHCFTTFVKAQAAAWGAAQ